MTDKEKLIDFLESSEYKYKLTRPSNKGKAHTIKNFVHKDFDEEIIIKEGCGYNFYGVFYFLNGKSVDYGIYE